MHVSMRQAKIYFTKISLVAKLASNASISQLLDCHSCITACDAFIFIFGDILTTDSYFILKQVAHVSLHFYFFNLVPSAFALV